MPDADRWAQPPKGHCITCGEELGADPHFIVDGGPNGEHTRCRDWSERPFFFETVLANLRRRYRQIERRADVDLLRDVVELGRWLAERERLWPEGAVETIRQGGARIDSVLSRLRDAGISIRR